MTTDTPDTSAQRRWLEQFIGEWEMAYGPETPMEHRSEEWQETGRMLHGVWAVVEGRGLMPGGGEATTILTLGYDSAKGKFVGTWIGSMMENLWVYEGDLGEDGRLVLNSEGPDFETGVMRLYRDVYAFDAEGRRTLESQNRQDDGTWETFMTAIYSRKA